MIYYFATKKRLMLDENTELCHKVREVEEELNQPLSLFDDYEQFIKYRKIYNLPVEERRLLIVWSLFDCSMAKVAKLFKVDVKTVKSRINEITEKIKETN